PDLVLDGDSADDRVAAGEVEDRRAAAAPVVGPFGELAGFREGPFTEEVGAADRVGHFVDRCFDAAAGDRSKVLRGRDRAAVASGGGDGAGERVLAVGLDTA